MIIKIINKKTYIFKAYYDYIVDNEDIPHLLVNPKYKGVVLPKQFTSTEELVLSISPAATHDFFIGKSGLSFDTRFSGKTFSVYLPYGCIQELIATESKIAIPIRVFFVPSEEEAGQENDSEGPGFEIMDEDDTPVSLDTSKEEPLKDKSSSPVTPEIEGSDLPDLLSQVDDKSEGPQDKPQAAQDKKDLPQEKKDLPQEKKEDSKEGDDPDFTILS